MNTQIQMSLNEAGFLNNLGSIFTTSEKVLNELCQNATRANASRITIELEIEDNQPCLYISGNGCGIQDWQKLLTIADTGWTGDTLKANPYGMGFLSAIFGCDSIEVDSKGKMFKATCEDIIGRMPISIEETDYYDGTIIVMRGIKPELKSYIESPRQYYFFGEESVSSLGMGYDIEVVISVNGETKQLSQNHSVTQLEQQSHLVKHSFEHGVIYFNRNRLNTHYRAYLQGAVILKQYGDNHIVHLNENTPARMPDRENLLEEKFIQSAIYKELKALIKHELMEELKSFDSLDNMTQYPLYQTTKEHWPCLLNDIDHVSTSIATSSEDYTLGRREIDNESNRSMISRKTLENATALYEYPDICDLEANDKVVYLKHLQNVYFVDTTALDSQHWLRKLPIQSFDTLDTRHSLRSKSTTVSFVSHYDIQVAVCEDYQFDGPLGSVVIDNCAVVLDADQWGNPLLIIPSKESAEYALAMLGGFEDEHGSYQETDFFHAEDNLTLLINQLQATSTQELLEKAILEAFSSKTLRDLLNTGTYSIVINDNGEVSVN